MTTQPVETARPRGSKRWIVAALVVVALAVPIAGYSLRGTGVLHSIRIMLGMGPKRALPSPVIIDTMPADASTGIDPGTPIYYKINLPNGPIDPASVSDESVGLFRFDNRQRVKTKVRIDGDKVVVEPLEKLDPNRNYRLHLLPGLKDVKGSELKQSRNTLAFFTSSKPPEGVAFEQVPQEASMSKDETKPNYYTSVAFWKDGKLYASTIDGRLVRFTVAADGTLSNREELASLHAIAQGPRLVTGFDFDPRSPVDEPIIYMPHSQLSSSPTNPTALEGAADFSGKIARISGPNFSKVEDVVVNLPQSYRDHCVNQPQFGPDGLLYVPMPSNTATGGPDDFWNFRKEHLLCATILQVDVDKLPQGQTLDVKTPDSGGVYNPSSPGAPVKIYAKGLRMPYSVLWHTNGRIYAAINGASSGGATPAGPNVPAVARVNLAEHDWLFDVKQDNYYGHPNDQYQRYVLNGGNPTQAPDFNEVADYPVGVKPDSDWNSGIFDFGAHISANGMTEYKSGVFADALRGKVFICRYNVGSDLICIGFDSEGKVNYAAAGIPGTSNLITPLDVVCDPQTGNLYVCELTAQRITLLRAKP
jgi:glucose/arabinose dehydrogenase